MPHLHENGFMPNYYWWTSQGEEYPQFSLVVLQLSYYISGERREEFNLYEQIIMDYVRPLVGQHIEQGVIGSKCMEENLNPEA